MTLRAVAVRTVGVLVAAQSLYLIFLTIHDHHTAFRKGQR